MHNPKETIDLLFAEGKGILAADESSDTATKRLDAVGVESTVETRRLYRELFFECPGANDYISGVIFYDETWWQKSSTGEPYPTYLASRGILPGIKVDQGLAAFGHHGETVTLGIEGLAERLDGYAAGGARFTKWRAAIQVNPAKQTPTAECLKENARRMAAHAKLAAARGMVAICEPEVLMDGNHSAADAERAIGQALDALFAELAAAQVPLSQVVVKTAMALPGKDSDEVEPAREVAAMTVRALKAHCPAELAGVVLLSGGQGPRLATAHLDAIADHKDLPWPIAYSYARAIQEEPLKVWAGKPENVDDARVALLHRLKLLAAADVGSYDPNQD
jgi:fructose-bisphosphate aldolase class I